MRTIVPALAAIAAMLLAPSAAHAQPVPDDVRAVDWTATGLNTGQSWENAYTTLQAALAAAAANPAITQIWVADGTYKPGTNRSDTFTIRPTPAPGLTLKLYGGFAGGETSLNQRDHLGNVTILSGEIGLPGLQDNIYHIVTCNLVTADASVIDGFTIRDGNATGAAAPASGYEASGGAGIYVVGLTAASDPGIVRCTFENNLAVVGAGIYIANRQCTDECGPDIRNCTFRNNSADRGAGVFVDDKDGPSSRPTMYNCLFHDNFAASQGSAVFADDRTGPHVIQCTISQNTCGGNGGAVHSLATTTVGSITVTNSIIWNNMRNTASTPVTDGPAQITTAGGTDFDFVTYSDVQLFTSGNHDSNNITADPQFLSPASDNFRLQCSSPARDAGSVTVVKPDEWDLDQDAYVTEDNPD